MIDPSHVHGANWQPTPGCPFCSCARYGQVITKQLSNAQLVVKLTDVYENDLQKGIMFLFGANRILKCVGVKERTLASRDLVF